MANTGIDKPVSNSEGAGGGLKRRMQSIVDRVLVRTVKYVEDRLREQRFVFRDPHLILWDRASERSADYIEDKLSHALLFKDREDLWDFALAKASADGLFAEFGVWNGASINWFAKRLSRTSVRVYGFDSFEGLKEDWHGPGLAKGAFDRGGVLPAVYSNVTLVKGWFDETVPRFLKEHPEPVSFLHLDADTYETTVLLLDLFKDRFRKGTVIVFDEYLGFPNWENGEFRAWKEFCAATNTQYSYLGFSIRQAAIQLL